MEVVVIGSSSAYPTKENPTSSYLIHIDSNYLLLDCGSGSMMALDQLVDLDELHNVFISHKHPDHIADLGVLQHRRLVKKLMNKNLPELKIFGSFEKHISSEIETIKNSQILNIKKVNKIGPFTVKFQKTIHPVECYAIRLEYNNKSIVYTSDTAFSKNLIKFSKNADLLITESSLYPNMDGTKAGHMNINEAIDFSMESGAKKTLLSHLPNYGSLKVMQNEVDKSGLENILFAKPNMKIKV